MVGFSLNMSQRLGATGRLIALRGEAAPFVSPRVRQFYDGAMDIAEGTQGHREAHRFGMRFR